MRVKDFSNYTKLYESKLMECEFFVEQNITSEDIITPLEDLITEEFIGKLIQKGKEFAGKVGQVAKNVATSVKTAIGNFFGAVVNFFKNFSLKKLASSIFSKIKEIGSKIWNKIKTALSGLSQFIVQNGLVNENNTPNFKNIWSVLCNKAKAVVDWKSAGVDPDQLKAAGDKVKINEADNYSISDEEVKYYGVFEKIAHALGIKNARFNGVVSQIMKKGTIGIIVMGLIKASGISLAFLGGMSLGPVAMAAIGGMLLMAGLIILAIWVCKPYPTLDDCLSYLHIAFGGHTQEAGMVNIFIVDVDITNTTNNITINGGGGKESQKEKEKEKDKESQGQAEAKPFKTMYPVMIKNLKALQSMIITFDGVKLQGEESGEGIDKATGLPIKKKKKQPALAEGYVLPFELFEKQLGSTQRNVTIHTDEDYLTQAFLNIRKSLKSLKDDKDKGIGITDKFVGDIIEQKMSAKEAVKALYLDIYEYLYGKFSKTLPDFGPLYKESVEVIENDSKRKVVAEKIARLAKRTLQFEGENMYGGMGEFGADMSEFNSTLKEIMDSIKAEK